MLLSFNRHILRSPGGKKSFAQINLGFFVDFEVILVDPYMVSLYRVILYSCVPVK